MKAFSSLLIASFLPISIFGQLNLDSLWGVWTDNSKHDTLRLHALHNFAHNGYLYSNPDSAYYFAQLQYDYAESKGLKKYMAEALTTQGGSLSFKSNFAAAREYYNRSLLLSEEIDYKKGIGGTLANIALTYLNQGEFDQAIEYYSRSQEIYSEIGFKSGLASTLAQLGACYRNKGEFTAAMDIINESYKLAEDIGDSKLIANALQNMGNIHWQQGNFTTAIDLYTRCLKIKEQAGDQFGIAALLANIAGVYGEQKFWDECIEYYTRCLTLFEKIGSKHGMAACYNGIGVAHEQLGLQNEAIEFFHKALLIREEMADKHGIAMTLGNIGVAYKNKGIYDKAIDYHERSMLMNEEMGQKSGVSTALHNISLVYQMQNDYVNAAQFAKRALDVAEDMGGVKEIRNAAESLWNALKNMGNFEESLKMYELFINMRDSIASERNIKELARFEFKYEYEKKALADSLRTLADIEARELNHRVEVAKKETERNLYASGGLFLLFITFLFYQRKVNKNKLMLKEKEAAYQQELIHASINSQEQERRRIAQDLHDEVGAMLSTIRLQLSAAANKLTPDNNPVLPAVNMVDETITNVRRISKDLLPPTLEKFGLANALNELADKVSEATGITIQKELPAQTTRMELERELALYRVIQEMMNNAMKHAEATVFHLRLKEQNGHLHLSFSDNGKGFDLHALQQSRSGQTGLGLKNLENRVGVAGGEMTLTSAPGKGTRVEVVVHEHGTRKVA